MATIAFFPEAAFGPALNSVGIAQAVQALGHKAVFLSDPGFVSVYEGYGFEAHPVNLSEPMPPEQMARPRDADPRCDIWAPRTRACPRRARAPRARS